MNRSILIVICDFLLVTLLAFSTVDIQKVTDQTSPRNMTMTIPAHKEKRRQTTASALLKDVLR